VTTFETIGKYCISFEETLIFYMNYNYTNTIVILLHIFDMIYK